MVSAVSQCGWETRNWVIHFLGVAFQTLEEDDVIKNVCDSSVTDVTPTLTKKPETTKLPNTETTMATMTLTTTVTTTATTAPTTATTTPTTLTTSPNTATTTPNMVSDQCDHNGATSCFAEFSAEVHKVVSTASTISGSSAFNASLIPYICRLYSDGYVPCATLKIRNCSSSFSITHHMVQHAFQFVCSPQNVANMFASLDCISKSEVVSSVQDCTARLQEDARGPVNACSMLTKYQLCILNTVGQECSAPIQPDITELLNHVLSPVYQLFRCDEVKLPVPAKPVSPTTTPGSTAPIDISKCDGACLTILKDKLFEISVNTSSGNFVFSDVTSICPEFFLYRECLTPWYMACPDTSMAVHDSLMQTFSFVCLEVYHDINDHTDCWTLPAVKDQFAICNQQMEEGYILNQDSCLQQESYKSCLLTKINELCPPRAGQILATYIDLAQSAACGTSATTATTNLTTQTTTATTAKLTTQTTTAATTNLTTQTTTAATTNLTTQTTTATTTNLKTQTAVTTSTNGTTTECSYVETTPEPITAATTNVSETENESISPFEGPIQCYECNSGYYPSYQNEYCPVSGKLKTWALSTSICDGPCVSKSSQWNKGDIFRGCSRNYYLSEPVPRSGCEEIGGEMWCFCDTDRCNSDAMEEFVDRD
ncbi:serine-rich adhesin for platelets-like [Gigantopelta aegis]|uniref:serine-rich adhesin for platelets-like n=1 Tax=Gigantopelta aegis TaxID=1735272 RepID=UPI001B88CDB8|nr:serine-rich adhesin for platelets-like [Gigantopelta aegis]